MKSTNSSAVFVQKTEYIQKCVYATVSLEKQGVYEYPEGVRRKPFYNLHHTPEPK